MRAIFVSHLPTGTWLLLETMLEREQRWTEVAPVESGSRPRRMLWREPLLVVMAFAAGMIILATSQNIKGHAKNAENAILPALPKEALTEAEIKRWVVKPGQSVPEIVRPPLGSNISIEGYQSSEMELTWLTGDIAKGTLCDHARKPAITAKAQTWVEYSSQRGAWAPNQRPAPKPTPQQAKVLSHFLVQGHPEPIEPLYGCSAPSVWGTDMRQERHRAFRGSNGHNLLGDSQRLRPSTAAPAKAKATGFAF